VLVRDRNVQNSGMRGRAADEGHILHPGEPDIGDELSLAA
jgi:hypothetical protein